jgi:hypothetical protein
MSYLTFTDGVAPRGWITKVWIVSSQGGTLGRVRFWTPWRKYIFEPLAGTMFDEGCLNEIAEFCRHQNDIRREGV